MTRTQRRKVRVLFVEDSSDDVELELAALREGGLDAAHRVVDTPEQLRAALAAHSWDVLLCDYNMPAFSGLAALALVKAFDPDVPFILVSGTIGEHAAVDAMRAGAHDYVLKDNLTRLAVAVERTLDDGQVRRDKRRVERAQSFLAEAGAALAESIEYHTTLSRVAKLAVPELGDVCAVDLTGADGELERVVVAHADPEHALAFEQHVHRVVVALEARGKLLGSLSFGRVRQEHAYDARDLEVARELARRAALAVDNAKLYYEAQQAIRIRDEFLSIASHELKTPLTAIQLQLQNLQEIVENSPPDSHDARLAPRLTRTAQSTVRLSFLVESLLDVSRIATGRMQLNRERFDLADAARGVCDRLNEGAQRAGSRITLTHAGAIVGSWDRLRIEQVLVNLLSNAIKYGGGSPIELHVGRRGAGAAIEVVDHGMGVPPEDMQRIFGRFERAVPVRHYGGLGLGLYITQQIVAAHAGKLSVSSTPGRGATFLVELPLEAEQSAGMRV